MSWETSGQRVLCYVVVVAFSSSSFTETCSLVSSQWSSVALFTSAFHYFARWVVRWSRIGAKDFCTNNIPWEGGGVSRAENKLNYSILVLFQCSLIIFWLMFDYVKVQLNSEWIHEVIVFPKIQTKNYKDFCPRSLSEGRAKIPVIFWQSGFWEETMTS